jgi:nicotinate (nicotinamide) nucleotide adenylyltransferase
MDPDSISKLVEKLDPTSEPTVAIIKHATTAGKRLGVFSSSFNPPTIAHLELMRRAKHDFLLDEILALAGKTNADKMSYECSLEDRLAMLDLALEDFPQASIGLSSHAFYADMIDAIKRVYPHETDLHFIVGFDTFERVLDPQDRYTDRYHRAFSGRSEALDYLLNRSHLIVAGRAGAGLQNLEELVRSDPELNRDRIQFLEFPADFGEVSSTDIRNRLRENLSITGLVPAGVENFIRKHRLYTK